MKPWLFLCGCLLSVAAFAADDSVSAPDAPLDPLAFLVGGTWVGTDVAGAKDGSALTIELTFTWTENHQAIRFDSSFVQGDKRKAYTSGMYAWNGEKKKVAIVYSDSSGALTEGLISRDRDEVFVNDLVVNDAKVGSYPVQVRLTRVGLEAFTNEIFLQKEGKWVLLVNVRYERKA